MTDLFEAGVADYVKRVLEPMQASSRATVDSMTDAQQEAWAALLERNEYFDGEVDLRYSYMLQFCDDRGIAVIDRVEEEVL